MLSKIVIAGFGLLLVAGPTLAQEAPEAAYKDFWCGTAFSGLAGSLPPEATEEDRALAASYTEGGVALMERASAAYAEAGFTPEQIAATQEELSGKVIEQISGSGDTAEFTYEDCAAVLPTPVAEEVPAEETPAAE